MYAHEFIYVFYKQRIILNLSFSLPFFPFKICFNHHISTLGSTFVFWIGIVIIRERFACLAKLPSPNSLGKSVLSTLLSGDSCRTGGIRELVNSIHSSI